MSQTNTANAQFPGFFDSYKLGLRKWAYHNHGSMVNTTAVVIMLTVAILIFALGDEMLYQAEKMIDGNRLLRALAITGVVGTLVLLFPAAINWYMKIARIIAWLTFLAIVNSWVITGSAFDYIPSLKGNGPLLSLTLLTAGLITTFLAYYYSDPRVKWVLVGVTLALLTFDGFTFAMRYAYQQQTELNAIALRSNQRVDQKTANQQRVWELYTQRLESGEPLTRREERMYDRLLSQNEVTSGERTTAEQQYREVLEQDFAGEAVTRQLAKAPVTMIFMWGYGGMNDLVIVVGTFLTLFFYHTSRQRNEPASQPFTADQQLPAARADRTLLTADLEPGEEVKKKLPPLPVEPVETSREMPAETTTGAPAPSQTAPPPVININLKGFKPDDTDGDWQLGWAQTSAGNSVRIRVSGKVVQYQNNFGEWKPLHHDGHA